MITPITKRNAREALYTYYERVLGVKLSRKSGVDIDAVKDGVIEYHLSNGIVKQLKVDIHTEYSFNELTPAEYVNMND